MSTADIKIVISNELAQRILDAIEFPLEITVPDDPSEPLGDLAAETGTEIVATGVTVAGHELVGESALPEASSAENAMLLRDLQLDADGDDMEIAGVLRDAANAARAGEGSNATAANKGGRVRRVLFKPLKRLMSVELIAMKLAVARPVFALGEQILFLNVEVGIQIKYRVCINYFGRKRCKTFQTDRIRLEARQLRLDLHTTGAKICVVPSFTDLDLVLKYSMFGVPFTTRPGIASIVNAQLRKKGPLELLDCSSFERSIPFSAGKLTVSAFTLASDPEGLAIDMRMTIS